MNDLNNNVHFFSENILILVSFFLISLYCAFISLDLSIHFLLLIVHFLNNIALDFIDHFLRFGLVVLHQILDELFLGFLNVTQEFFDVVLIIIHNLLNWLVHGLFDMLNSPRLNYINSSIFRLCLNLNRDHIPFLLTLLGFLILLIIFSILIHSSLVLFFEFFNILLLSFRESDRSILIQNSIDFWVNVGVDCFLVLLSFHRGAQ